MAKCTFLARRCFLFNTWGSLKPPWDWEMREHEGSAFPFTVWNHPDCGRKRKHLAAFCLLGVTEPPPPPPPSPPRMTQWEREGKRETLPHAKKLNGEAVPQGREYCRAGSAQRSIGGRGRRLPLRLSHLPSQGVGGRSVRWEVGGRSTVRYLKIEHCDTQI